MRVSYVQLGSNTSSDVYLARKPVLSDAHIDDVFEHQLWYRFIWYVDGVPYCKTINKSFCLLTFSSAGNYSVNFAATVLVNVTAGSQSTLIKKKSKVIQRHLLIKGKQITCLNSPIVMFFVHFCYEYFRLFLHRASFWSYSSLGKIPQQ